MLRFKLSAVFDEVARRQGFNNRSQLHLNVFHDIHHATIRYTRLQDDSSTNVLAIDGVWPAGLVDVGNRFQWDLATFFEVDRQAAQSLDILAVVLIQTNKQVECALAGENLGHHLPVHRCFNELVHLDGTQPVQQ